MHVANAFLQNSKAAVESVLSELGKDADGNALQDIVLSCQLSAAGTFLTEAQLTIISVFIDMLAKYCAFTNFFLHRNSLFRFHESYGTSWSPPRPNPSHWTNDRSSVQIF